MSFYEEYISATEEFQRIKGIPRRTWTEKEVDELVREMTALLKTAKGTQTLRPIQALALYEGGEQEGLLAFAPVGEGKTLISLMAAYVIECKTPLLLLPASLLDKTQREIQEYSRHWKIPLHVHKASIEALGRVEAAKFLEGRVKPDLIIIDEAHRFKNPKAACTKRLIRYFKENPSCKLFAMSGTLQKKSIKDWAHLSHFALKQNSVLPYNYGELSQWADVLDSVETGNPCRTHPGALLELATDEERKQGAFRAAKAGFQRRLLETPGVVSSKGADVASSIYVNAITFKVAPVTEENFRKLRKTWMTPCDWPLMQATEVWSHACQLALGFHYAWSPRPPSEWMKRRALWAKFVRKALARTRHLDSPKQVELAVLAGEIKDTLAVKENGKEWVEEDILAKWLEVQDSFKPNTVIKWHDESALNVCLDWGKKNKGIIWTDHSFFGRELARRGGWQYFGREGVNDAKVPIDLRGARHEGETIVASRHSNATGRNLQYGWNKNLVVVPPGSSDLEQLLGRTHRTGQTEDEVIFDLLFGCDENIAAFVKAIEGSKVVQGVMGQMQKILMADVTVDLKALNKMQGPQWTRTLSEKDANFILPE